MEHGAPVLQQTWFGPPHWHAPITQVPTVGEVQVPPLATQSPLLPQQPPAAHMLGGQQGLPGVPQTTQRPARHV